MAQCGGQAASLVWCGAVWYSKQAMLHKLAMYRVAQRDDVASNLVAQELSGAQDVFGLLESDGVERHLDGGLRVAPHDGGARHEQAMPCTRSAQTN